MNVASQTQALAEAHIPGFVFGASPAVRSLNDAASEIAPTDIPVLILGESGSGKDAYARLLHRLSQRHESQFFKINCAALDPNQLSRCLHPDETHSPATSAHRTLYLDNVQELDLVSQRMLLSLLPDEDNADSGDGIVVRLISSSAINLEPEIDAGRFRRELYFRLNGACLRLPALRERIQDVPLLMECFLEKYARSLKKTAPHLPEEVIRALSSFSWPGNIRELENLARKMVVFGDAQIAMSDFEWSTAARHNLPATAQAISLKVAARAASVKAERELILQALDRTHWNRKRAARELQISYKSLLYKIKQIGVSEEKHED